MPPQIHLIEHKGFIKKVEGRVHDSMFWDVPMQTAERLIGGSIYFHKKQKEPSFFGGRIIGYRIHDEADENSGRIVFRFEADPTYRGVLAGVGGWSYEKKIVW
ncbi:MAG TPA: hypothetical protein VF538_00355 [Pyrinomonadaceae bacterium]|jgi:hypothetical protein